MGVSFILAETVLADPGLKRLKNMPLLLSIVAVWHDREPVGQSRMLIGCVQACVQACSLKPSK
jgi:hypothetical protein